MTGTPTLRPSAKPIDIDEAASLYQQDDWTLRDLARKYRVSYSSLRSRFLRYGLPVRSRSDAIALARRRHPERFDVRGSKNPAWNGGRSKDSRGYITISSMHWKREHRVVAEAMLGRPLLREEVVHHINGRKDDNRPANLQVMTRTAHNRLHARGPRGRMGRHHSNGRGCYFNNGR